VQVRSVSTWFAERVPVTEATMRTAALPALLLLPALAAAGAAAESAHPLSLHPENPHYFLFRGKPAVLITSGEHYGDVLNRDFDYLPYLDELHARGFNLTRTFSGTYREVPGSFHIVDNTLAPTAARWACPWARSDLAGAGDGGNKFDLEKWDPAYFERLRDFVAQAGKRGIVVELGLFCTIYDEPLWAISPMNPANNRQGIGPASRLEVFTARDPKLLAVQQALARKLAAELRDADNVYFEVCNEPYFGGVTAAWTDRIVAALVDAESGGPRHLIAQNIANGSAEIKNPNPNVSVFNFHYATPPQTVAANYRLNRAIADDETGFRGVGDQPYRTEGWDFLLAGGAVYSNLDYSYTPKHPDGTFRVTTSPGGGGPALRRQLQALKQFMDGLDFVHMKPDNAVIKGGRVTAPLTGNPAEARVTARALVAAGKAYAVYVRGGTRAELAVDLPAGHYRAEWIDTRNGAVAKAEDFEHGGGTRALASPEYAEDIALRVRRTAGKP
jgi:hypothetical protein